MIAEGFVLMIVGMVTVFVFLALLVFAMALSAAFFKKYAHLFPEPVLEKSRPKTKTAADHADIAVAIAAVKAFIK